MTVKSYSVSGDCVYQKDGGKIEVSRSGTTDVGKETEGLI